VTLNARDLRQTDTRILLQSFLSQWIPLSVSVLGKIFLKFCYLMVFAIYLNYIGFGKTRLFIL